MTERTCPCGSEKRRYPLVDARGIFCCFYCDDCEETQTKKYRREVLTNPNYECDEAIEED